MGEGAGMKDVLGEIEVGLPDLRHGVTESDQSGDERTGARARHEVEIIRESQLRAPARLSQQRLHPFQIPQGHEPPNTPTVQGEQTFWPVTAQTLAERGSGLTHGGSVPSRKAL